MSLTANEKSYRGIRNKLESGDLAPGDQLVTRNLATEFGVSLSPIREAINRLATEGFVDHTPGAGAQVKRMTSEDLNDLYVLRDAIESCAAALAAETITPAELDELEFYIKQQHEIAQAIAGTAREVASKKQHATWLQLEENFHGAIIRCSRNKLLVKVIEDNRAISRIFELQIKATSILTAEVAKKTVDGKRQLLKVFRSRDAELARTIMSDQIQRGRNTVVDHMRREELR